MLPRGKPPADVIPGSLASLDSTLPPTPLKDLLAADGASVYVLSFDAELVQAVQQAGGDQYPVTTVGDWPELVEAVRIGRSRIVLLDADAVNFGLAKAIAELRRDARVLVILVAARREEAQGLMSLLSDRQIHRLLIKPAALGITRLLLDSAVSRYLQVRDSSVAEPEPLPEPSRRKTNASLPAKWPAWLVATALVSVLLGAVLVGGLTRLGGSDDERQAARARSSGAASSSGPAAAESEAAEGSTSPTAAGAAAEQAALRGTSSPSLASTLSATAAPAAATTAPPQQGGALAAGEVGNAAPSGPQAGGPPAAAVPVGANADRIAELLRRAAVATVEGRLSSPAGDSALDYYAEIVALDLGHVEAGTQLNALLDTLFGQAEAALLEGSLDAAAAALGDIRRVQPSSGRLAFLDAQLESARADEALAAGDASDTTEAAIELQSLLTIGRARLERGQLLEPDGDSARAYLDRAAALRADDPGVLQLRVDLASGVAAAARVAIGDGDLERAALLAEEAFGLGADREELTLLDLNLAEARQRAVLERHAQLFAAAMSSLEEDRLVAPEEDNALYYLATLRAENPGYAGLAEQWRQFASTVAANARAAIAAADWEGAATWTEVLRGAEVDAELVDTLEYERVQAQYLATPAPASTLWLIESTPQAYPQDALRNGLEGWVEVDFIVDTEGRTRSISVLQSSTGDRFDAAAIETVAGQRYEPFEQDGRVYERRVQVRIRFTLE